MQLLLDCSHEFGLINGLGLIPGKVEPIPALDNSGARLKIPHIGWSNLVCAAGRASWNETLLDSIEPHISAVYFVHSYMAVPENGAHRVADCVYGDTAVAAVIGRDNVWGAQFHPEKSGKVGLSMLSNFVALK
ncbi:Imidazole glycerol phosphate synthase subunit HisH [Pseudomonas fluorescens]|nr:Imidazole glycerol phosphate synthase subunit HisH [Pseudomonas fluorescens]